MFLSLGEYDKPKECLEKALATQTEIGDREGEASSYGNLGTVFQSVGEYHKTKEYLDKALAIKKKKMVTNWEKPTCTETWELC